MGVLLEDSSATADAKGFGSATTAGCRGIATRSGWSTFSRRTAAYLRCGCFDTGSQAKIVSSFAARERSGESQ